MAWAEFVTTSVILGYHIKEVWILKAWGGRYAERAWGEHSLTYYGLSTIYMYYRPVAK